MSMPIDTPQPIDDHYSPVDNGFIKTAKKIKKQREFYTNIAAAPFAVVTILVMTVIGTVGTAILFPGLPLWALGALSAAGLIVDTIFYTRDTLGSFDMIFGTKLFPDLENHVIERELMRPAEDKVEQCLNRKRAEYGKELEELEAELAAEFRKNDESIKDCKNKDLSKEAKETRLKALAIERDGLKKRLETFKNTKKIAFSKLKKALKEELYGSDKQDDDCCHHKEEFYGSRKVVNEYLMAWRLVRSGALKMEKQRELKPMSAGEANRKVKNKVLQACEKSQVVADQVGLRVDRILKSARTELIIKKILIVLGVILAAINGIGWGCMAVVHVPLLFAGIAASPAWLSMVLTMPALATVAATPFILPIVAGAAGIALGVCWFMIIYKVVSSAIKKNIFKEIWHKLALFRKPDWSGRLPPLWLHCFKLMLKLIPVAVVLAIGLVTAALGVGALLDATVQVAAMVMQYSDKVVNTVIRVIMSLALPFSILFSLKHGVGALNKSLKLCQKAFFSKEALNDIWNHIKKKPAMSVLYAVGFVVAGGAFLVHLVAEAASTAGEGAAGLTGIAGKIFKSIAKLFGLRPTIFATAGAVLTEGLEHLDFVLRDTLLGIDNMCKGFKKIWNWCVDKPLESTLEQPTEEEVVVKCSHGTKGKNSHSHINIELQAVPTKKDPAIPSASKLAVEPSKAKKFKKGTCHEDQGAKSIMGHRFFLASLRGDDPTIELEQRVNKMTASAA